MSAEKLSTYCFKYENTIKWDARYDVVVIGAGGSGIPAAIEACDMGAKVLIVEKAEKGKEGANARVSQQHLLVFGDYDDGVEYLKKMRLGCNLAVPDEAIETFVRESMKFEDWWHEQGYNEYEVHDQTDFPHLGGKTSKILYTERPNTHRYWPSLRKLLANREDRIDIWYQSPADKLIQDPFTRTVLGVRVKTDGRYVNVRAKNGVVMALGGFEDSSEMLQQYGCIPYPADSTGTQTGDGIRMSIEVGAKLARMGAISGPYPVYTDPENGKYTFHIVRTFIGTSGGYNSAKAQTDKVQAAIIVGPDGTRFYDETTALKHGDMMYHGQFRKLVWPNPAYVIIDAGILEKEIHAGWGEGNKTALENGWVKFGATPAELAAKLGIDADGLTKTIDRYNRFCEAGVDEDYGRKDNLYGFSGKGYCAVLVTPGRYNTTGGPDRNMKGEILGTDGKPIPHLYGCGDLGGFGVGNYSAGFGLVEAWYSGRIAGKNAAESKTVIPNVVINIYGEQGDGDFVKASEEELEIELGENEYLGKGEGMNGTIAVKLVYKNNEIQNVEIVREREDKQFGGRAFPELIPAILAANSAEVDAVSGATMSSEGLKGAVRDALRQAKQ